MKAAIAVLIAAVSLSGCAAPSLDDDTLAAMAWPLITPTPYVTIKTMPAADLAVIQHPTCHADWGVPKACTHSIGHPEIIMPPYSHATGEWYSATFAHELWIHALRGLCHNDDGRGIKKCPT